MDCINCSAPLPAKTTRCPFCHTINDIDLRGRVTVKGGQTERDCPRCQQSLTAVMLGVGGEQVEIDRCLKCQGLFFDPGEVETILDGIEQRAESVDHRQLLTLIESETPTEDFETVSYVPCPDCKNLMNRRSFGQKSGVIIDSCREHGLWLDGGELRRLIRWTQAGGRQHDAQRLAEKARIEENLRQTPSHVPSAETFEPAPFERRNKTLEGVGDALELLDVVRGVVGLVRIFT